MDEELKNRGWHELTFLDIAKSLKRGPFGGNLKKAFFVPTGYKVYEQQHAINKDFQLGTYFINDKKYEELKGFAVGSGDYIISCSGTIGKLYRLPKEAPSGVINQALLKITLEDGLLTHSYFSYLFQSAYFQRQILSDARGTGMQNLAGMKEIKVVPVFIPPFPEQRKIVEKLDELISELDNGITNLKAAKDKLEIYRQAVLKKAFEGELTKEWREQQSNLPTADELLEQIKEERLKHYENQLTEWEEAVVKWEASGKKGRKPSKPKKIKGLPQLSETDLNGHTTLPASWKWVKLDEVTQRASKVKKESLNPNDIFKYFDIGGIDNKTQRILSFKTYRWKEAPSRAQQIVEFGDTLFSTVRTYLKNIGQVNKREYHNEICSTGFTVIRGIENKINPNFLFYLSTSEFFIQPLNKLQVGTSYPAVKDDDVFNQPFPLCSYAEQNQIVQEIESRLSVCDNILANIEEGLEKSEALRQSILKQAFEGKLLSEEELEACRQEPDWEPAEKLLERVKIQKEVTV